MLRWGPDHGPVVVMALPLLEEANRVRAFAASICRALSGLGVASALPDLPETGDSLANSASLRDLREAFAAAARGVGGNRPVHGATIRSGALLDGAAPLASRWSLAAQDGARLLREWQRVADAAAREAGTVGPRLAEVEALKAVDIAGHRLPGSLLAELAGAFPAGLSRRHVRLEGDPEPADLHVPGAPLWRRAEPGNDPVLAQILADDIAQRVRTCEGC